MRQILFFFTIIVIFFSCSSNFTIEEKIVKTVKQIDCKSKPYSCVIRLTNLTTFQWDKMYVFLPNTEQDTINKIIGQVYHDFVPYTRIIIFLKSDKIVFFENDRCGISDPVDGQVFFPFNRLGYDLYTPNNAIFTFLLASNNTVRLFTPLAGE